MQDDMRQNMVYLPTWLRVPLNQYGFVTVLLVPALVIAALLGIGGYSTVKFLIILAMFAGIAVYWWVAHARQTASAPRSEDDLLHQIDQSGKYALVALESEFCLSSTSVGKRLQEFEDANPNHFSVMSLSVLSEPGRKLYQKYNARVTPTYVLLDPKGNMLEEWPLVLPVERVQYAVKQNQSKKST